MAIQFTNNVTLISAVGATTTSAGIDVSKRQQIVVQFIASGVTSGNGVFTIDGTNDASSGGTNWTAGISFRDGTATASTTWVTSKTLNSNGSALAFVQPGFAMIRVKVSWATDGAYSAILQSGG